MSGHLKGNTKIWHLNFRESRICVEFGFRRSQLSWRIYLRCNFCRLIKAVAYALDAEKRWRSISASLVSSSRAQTRTRITVINAESAGEFPKTKVVFYLVQQFSRLVILFYFFVWSIKRKELFMLMNSFSQLRTLLEMSIVTQHCDRNVCGIGRLDAT